MNKNVFVCAFVFFSLHFGHIKIKCRRVKRGRIQKIVQWTERDRYEWPFFCCFVSSISEWMNAIDIYFGFFSHRPYISFVFSFFSCICLYHCDQQKSPTNLFSTSFSFCLSLVSFNFIKKSFESKPTTNRTRDNFKNRIRKVIFILTICSHKRRAQVNFVQSLFLFSLLFWLCDLWWNQQDQNWIFFCCFHLILDNHYPRVN